MALVTHQNNGKICFHFRMSHDLTIVPIVKRHEVIYENMRYAGIQESMYLTKSFFVEDLAAEKDTGPHTICYSYCYNRVLESSIKAPFWTPLQKWSL